MRQKPVETCRWRVSKGEQHEKKHNDCHLFHSCFDRLPERRRKLQPPRRVSVPQTHNREFPRLSWSTERGRDSHCEATASRRGHGLRLIRDDGIHSRFHGIFHLSLAAQSARNVHGRRGCKRADHQDLPHARRAHPSRRGSQRNREPIQRGSRANSK